jgi:predicted RNA-binding Zn-ribbon protein involved in translation (DUF1610 family)
MNGQGLTETDWMEVCLEKRVMTEPIDCPECGSMSIARVEDDEFGVIEDSEWECDECGINWIRGE